MAQFKLKLKRGAKANLPTLDVGEPALCTDTGQIYIGGSNGNIEIEKKDVGSNAIASGIMSHAEGLNTTASGNYSHAEGTDNTASTDSSHAEGSNNTVSGDYSHVEGYYNIVSGVSSHAEGYGNKAEKDYTHAEGYCNTSGADSSHVEGNGNMAYGVSSHAEGNGNSANGASSHVEGNGNKSNGDYSHAEGSGTTADGQTSHTEGLNTIAIGQSSHAEGNSTNANGLSSHAEGSGTIAKGQYCHSEGLNTSSGTYDYLLTSPISGLPSHIDFGKGYPEITIKLSLTDINNFNGDEIIKLDAYGDNSESCIGREWIIAGIDKSSGTLILDCQTSTEFVNSQNIISISNFVKVGYGYAHAEGKNTTASGQSSHAEGINAVASGLASHAECINTKASGQYSHAEGYGCVAGTAMTHAEGKITLSSIGTLYNITAFDNTKKTITLDNITNLSVGDLLDIFCTNGIVTDVPILAINGFIITLNTTANFISTKKYAIKRSISAYPSHSEGIYTIASGNGSHAEGTWAIASGNYSHAEGTNTTASGINSHAEGTYGSASGQNSHAEGLYTTASGRCSHAEGTNTTANILNSHVMGQYNKLLTGDPINFSGSNDAFVIGNGTGPTVLSNAFRISFDGSSYGLSAFNSTGADYAEYFEWFDENINNEDRVGYFVTLDGDKIKKANSTDEYILGIVSATPSVVGDNYFDDWKEKYITDDFGRIQYQNVTISAEYATIHHDAQYEDKIIPQTVDNNGNIIAPETIKSILIKEAYDETIEILPERVESHPIINPEWDSSKEYVNRENRKEWSPIGMMGKLIVRDDGTCNVNDYCKPNDDGIATSCDKTSAIKYKVMKRIKENLIQVLIK